MKLFISNIDVTFSLHTGKYFPYRKPNNDPLYINIHSKHPSTIKKELPNMINKRLSELSCDKNEFDKAKGIYEKALNESDFNTKLSYQNEPSERKNRNRKIIWFNPPYNESVKTNIGKHFLKLVFFFFFFLSGFSFTDTDNSQDSRVREGTILFHSTTSTRSRTFRHLFATLHVR